MAGLTFNADEVFEMAEEIERNGAKFYRKAAENARKQSVRELLADLASMEDHHLDIFEEMRRKLAKEERAATVYDPDDEAAMYLKAMADKRVFDTSVDPSAVLKGDEPITMVLHTAIGLEKDSVVFYLGIRDAVPAKLGRDKIEDIIKEEMNHIAILSRELANAS